jgi:hypothetical protein
MADDVETLRTALRNLVLKVHEINKATEYLFVNAWNHHMEYKGPQYGEELREAERLVGLSKPGSKVP